MNTSKALIDVNHTEPERWSPPLIDADWYAFSQALYKGIEGKDREEMYDSYKVMSKAMGVKKPQAMIWLAKLTFWEEIRRDWSCGNSTSKIQLLRWTEP